MQLFSASFVTQITSAFQKAFLAIRDGADVGETLGKAVRTIDEDIEDNRGYAIR